MKLARELGTMTYRSGPEWDERFSRKRIDPNEDPALCPTFLIESYLDYQGLYKSFHVLLVGQGWNDYCMENQVQVSMT